MPCGTGYLAGFGQFVGPAPQEIDIKKGFEEFLRAVRGEVLTQAGTYVARTPEGRAAIEEEALRQARAKAVSVGGQIAPWIPLVALGGLLLLTMRR